MARKKSAARRARLVKQSDVLSGSKAVNASQDIQEDEIDKTPKILPEPLSEEAVSDQESEDDSGSSSEEEDENGELITDDVEEGIQKILETIRQDPTKLLDPKLNFFKGSNEETENSENKKDVIQAEKPVYLKDYHRLNLLNKLGEEEEKPYALQNKEDRERLVAEIHDAVEDEDDGFLKVAANQKQGIEETSLPDPTDETFLQEFMNQKAWIARGKSGRGPKLNLEEDDEDFDHDADKFESAYNFRFEDPNSAEIVSYARDSNTLRRKDQNSRKKQRSSKDLQKKQAKEEYDSKVAGLKKQKVKEVVKKLEKLQEVIDDEDVSSKFTEQDLEGDFEGSAWDKMMQQVFNEEYYNKSDIRPEWSDEENDERPQINENNEKEIQDEESEPLLSKAKKAAKEKKKAKEARKELLAKAENVVEENIDLLLEESNIENPEAVVFRYREVSPDSYGLTPRDILLASDNQLNEFVGLKKLASFRDAEKKVKDRRKYAKKKRLREWRKSIFETEEEPSDELVSKILSKAVEPESSKKRHKKNHH